MARKPLCYSDLFSRRGKDAAVERLAINQANFTKKIVDLQSEIMGLQSAQAADKVAFEDGLKAALAAAQSPAATVTPVDATPAPVAEIPAITETAQVTETMPVVDGTSQPTA